MNTTVFMEVTNYLNAVEQKKQTTNKINTQNNRGNVVHNVELL